MIFQKILFKEIVSDLKKDFFSNMKFDYIVGNPPWIPITDESEMLPYWNEYRDNFTLEKQSSQCFLHKIKSWSKENTRYGFVVNSSNFLNNSNKFQNFFYSTYDIEWFYELSSIKDLLFYNAREGLLQ